MTVFDNHKKCARCRDKGVGDDVCVKKQECKICQALTPAQLKQLSTPTYQSRKERELKKSSSDSPSSATPTLVDPADVSVLGRVHKESVGSSPANKKKRADPSPTPKASSKKKSSSKSRSDDLKELDEKWCERFARLEAMLVSKTFMVPVNPVQNPPSVVTSDQPFFDPGTSTSGLSSGVTVGDPGSSLVQTTGEAAVIREAVNKSATHPVDSPCTDVKQQNATQPVEAPGAGTATQPVEAPGAGPDVLPSGTGSAAFLVLTVRKNSRVIQDLLMATSGTVPQTSPGMKWLIRSCLKSLPTGRLSEARCCLWVSIRSLNLTVCLLQITTLLPVPELHQPVKCL